MSLPGLRYTLLLCSYCKSGSRWSISKVVKPPLCLQHHHHQTRGQHQQSGAQTKANVNVLSTKLVHSFNQNVNWFKENYDRVFGIAEISEIQNRVLEAETDFVEITQKRKLCQDRIEKLKDEIKSIRDKLEITPRQNDKYLCLITEEHKLIRQQGSIELELSQYKEREQLYLDNLSKLLRQSHELERLRQERSKYWQIISISLSLAASLVALVAQKARNQRSVTNRLDLMDHRLSEMVNSAQVMENNLLSRIDTLQLSLDQVTRSVGQLSVVKVKQEEAAKKHLGPNWMLWIPGLTTVWSWSSSILFP